MAGDRYAFKLTPDDLKDSENGFIKREGLIYTVDGRSKKGVNQLHADWIRGVRVGSKKLDEKEQETLKNDPVAFTKFLEESFGEKNAENIVAHYSQGPLLLISGALCGTFFQPDSTHFLVQPRPADIKSNLYRDKKDNQIYIKLLVDQYPVLHRGLGGKAVDYLKGPVEMLFSLNPKAGFELKSIETNSETIRDMFKNAEIDKDEKAKFNDPFKIRLAEEKYAKLEQVKKELQELEGTLGEKVEQKKVITDAIKAMSEYEQGNLNELQLIKKLHSLDTTSKLIQPSSWWKQKQASVGFTPAPSQASRVLTKICKDLESLLLRNEKVEAKKVIAVRPGSPGSRGAG